MYKKGFLGRLKVLSKPTGKTQWKLAAKSMILMIFAAILAKLLGFEQGIGAVVFVTLLATIILDLPLPLRKIAPMGLIGFLMTFLAFICSSLAISNLPAFLIFTVIWAFFSLSMYIFGEYVGLFGFMIFSGYFVSVIMVRQNLTTLDWGLCVVLAYLVSSIILIPKIVGKKKFILNLISAPFIPKTSLESVLSIRSNLSGVPLDERDYELFKIGNYLVGFRGYGNLMLSRLSGTSKELLENFINSANQTSLNIASSISGTREPVNLRPLMSEIDIIKEKANPLDPNSNTILELANEIKFLLKKSNELLNTSYPSSKKLKIISASNSLKEVLGANFNLNNMYIRHALRFTLAMTLGLLAVFISHERDAIWITMGILIIIKPDVTSTLDNIIVRVPFNFLAILIAIVMGFLFPHEILLIIAFLMLFLFRAFYPGYMGLSVMAMSVFVVLIWPTGPLWENAIARIIDISIGAVIAFICAYLILPSRVTTNLPEQIARTIRSNLEYLEAVLPGEESTYNHEKVTSIFRNCMLQEKNLESTIKKVDDTFNDVEEDMKIYNEFLAANRKLSADISAVATLTEAHDHLPEVSRFKDHLSRALSEISLSVDKNVILPTFTIDKLPSNKTIKNSQNDFKNPQTDDLLDNLHNYLNWITSDVQYLQEVVDSALKTDALKRYRNMA